MNTMNNSEALATFLGVWIGFVIVVAGLASMVAMFVNNDPSLGGIALYSSIMGFGITLVIAILKPI
jgi:hypothetical protein